MNFSVELSPRMRELLARPVAVFGAGVSGRAVAGLLARIGAQWVFYDTKGRNNVREFGPQEAAGHGLVVYSPGFAEDHPWLCAARTGGCVTLGEMEFAFRFWHGPLVCITGSNGKTTITELVTSLLNSGSRKALAVGNIGRPLSDVALRPECADRTAVCEISSFQAESLDRFRADALIWVNFFNNHLDRHGDLRGYFAAKWKLVERLRGRELVVGRSVADAAERFGYVLPDFAQVVDADSYVPWPMPRTSAFFPKRPAENLLLVRRWWATAGQDPLAVRKAAEALGPLPHRLNAVPAPSGKITFWNDSKATNHQACIGALENFENKVLWIGGGRDRGEKPEELAEAIAPRLRMAFVTGETAPLLAARFGELGVPCTVCEGLSQAVQAAWENALPADDIIFSPGHSSHDSFRDYNERGNYFESCVAKLGDRVWPPSDHPSALR